MVEKMEQILGQQPRRAATRRSPFEVRMDILKVMTNGCTRPTQMMYRSNTSWIVLHKNLVSLIASGFVLENVDSSGTVYSATERGIDVFRGYANLVRLASAYPGPIVNTALNRELFPINSSRM